MHMIRFSIGPMENVHRNVNEVRDRCVMKQS